MIRSIWAFVAFMRARPCWMEPMFQTIAYNRDPDDSVKADMSRDGNNKNVYLIRRDGQGQEVTE